MYPLIKLVFCYLQQLYLISLSNVVKSNYFMKIFPLTELKLPVRDGASHSDCRADNFICHPLFSLCNRLGKMAASIFLSFTPACGGVRACSRGTRGRGDILVGRGKRAGGMSSGLIV